MVPVWFRPRSIAVILAEIRRATILALRPEDV